MYAVLSSCSKASQIYTNRDAERIAQIHNGCVESIHSVLKRHVSTESMVSTSMQCKAKQNKHSMR